MKNQYTVFQSNKCRLWCNHNTTLPSSLPKDLDGFIPRRNVVWSNERRFVAVSCKRECHFLKVSKNLLRSSFSHPQNEKLFIVLDISSTSVPLSFYLFLSLFVWSFLCDAFSVLISALSGRTSSAPPISRALFYGKTKSQNIQCNSFQTVLN